MAITINGQIYRNLQEQVQYLTNITEEIKPYTAGTGITISGQTIAIDPNSVQLKLTAGDGITVTGNTISVDYNDVQAKLKDGRLGYVTAKMFGAVGDGVHDDTQAIQNAINSSNYVFIDNGTYLINGSVGLTLRSNLVIQMCPNTVLQRTTTETKRKSVLEGSGIENVIICGGHIYGDLRDHEMTSGIEYQNHGIEFLNCKNILVDGVDIAYNNGDCLLFGNGQLYSDNIVVKNCKLHDSFRHGIAITGAKHGVIKDCDIYGITWLDGIDFESDNTYGSSDFEIINVKIHDFNTQSYSVNVAIMNHDCTNLTIDSCYVSNQIYTKLPLVIKNSKVNTVGVTSPSKFTDTDVLFISNSNLRILYLVDFSNVFVDTCNFVDTYNLVDSMAGVGCRFEYQANEKKPNCKFSNCYFESSKATPLTESLFYYINSNPNTLEFDNCDFLVRSDKTVAIKSAKCRMLNSYIHFELNDLNSYGALDSYSNDCFIDNLTVDVKNITQTDYNGLIRIYGNSTTIINSTIYSNSAVGGVYDGNAITASSTDVQELVVIGCAFPKYSKVAHVTNASVLKQANNVISTNLS